MTISLYDITVPVFVPMLGNMAAWLGKWTGGEALLLGTRLAPDMGDFAFQYKVAATQATGIARLTGAQPPALPEPGEDFASVRALCDAAIGYLRSLAPADFVGGDARPVEMRFPNGVGIRYPDGFAYLNGFVLPNFYFHATTAYDILRSLGADMAKGDYLAGLAPREMLGPA